MNPISYTLLTDGSSDRRLLPIVTWTLQRYTERPISAVWADFGALRTNPRSLRDRIGAAVELFPSDLLFVHRDSERQPRDRRANEIRRASAGLAKPPIVAVITVRMQEAWFLFDEQAIRIAVANPHGTNPLRLPRFRDVEALANPKGRLFDLLAQASGLTGRHLRRLNLGEAAHRLATVIQDFAPLRQLPAFTEYEHNTRAALEVAVAD